MSFPKDRAFVTLLMLNDGFLPGVLLQAYELLKQAPSIPRVCLVTEEITSVARSALLLLYDHVVLVDKIYVPHMRRQERQDRPYLLTKLQAMRLGPDGDVGLGYRKIVFLDADILPLKRFDQLFLLDTPAGILNERKSHFVAADSKGRFIKPKGVDISGRWIWHHVYRRVGHGCRIPKDITERVRIDHSNLGVNTALMVLRPSLREYSGILKDVKRPSVRKLLSESFDWPDMQYLTLKWSGSWVNIDISFCGFCGYPSLSSLCGTHYAGLKPWSFRNAGSFAHYSRFPDFQYWHQRFLRMMSSNPDFYRCSQLSRLSERIQRV